MGGKAITAAVYFSDGKRDTLARSCIQGTLRKGAVRPRYPSSAAGLLATTRKRFGRCQAEP